MREIDFPDLIPRLEKVEEDRLVRPSLAELEVVAVNRRFRAVFLRYIVPGAAGGQDVQDTVDQSAWITPRSADMWLRWGGGISERPTGDHRQFPGNAMTPGFIFGAI